jgi:hypothetical protein
MDAKTVHNTDCKRVFKNYDATCPRCQELANGASARKGWNSRREQDLRRCAEIRSHFQSDAHRSGKCGPVCTFGEW